MSPENGEVYVMRGHGDEEWVSPTPVDTAVVEAVTSVTDLDPADIDDLEAYVDLSQLRALLSGEAGEAMAFRVEGHEVTVAADGEIDVSE